MGGHKKNSKQFQITVVPLILHVECNQKKEKERIPDLYMAPSDATAHNPVKANLQLVKQTLIRLPRPEPLYRPTNILIYNPAGSKASS